MKTIIVLTFIINVAWAESGFNPSAIKVDKLLYLQDGIKVKSLNFDDNKRVIAIDSLFQSNKIVIERDNDNGFDYSSVPYILMPSNSFEVPTYKLKEIFKKFAVPDGAIFDLKNGNCLSCGGGAGGGSGDDDSK